MSVNVRPNPVADPALTGTVLCLVGLGAIMAGSASIGIADESVGQPLYFFFQHLGNSLPGNQLEILILLFPVIIVLGNEQALGKILTQWNVTDINSICMGDLINEVGIIDECVLNCEATNISMWALPAKHSKAVVPLT